MIARLLPVVNCFPLQICPVTVPGDPDLRTRRDGRSMVGLQLVPIQECAIRGEQIGQIIGVRDTFNSGMNPADGVGLQTDVTVSGALSDDEKPSADRNVVVLPWGEALEAGRTRRCVILWKGLGILRNPALGKRRRTLRGTVLGIRRRPLRDAVLGVRRRPLRDVVSGKRRAASLRSICGGVRIRIHFSQKRTVKGIIVFHLLLLVRPDILEFTSFFDLLLPDQPDDVQRPFSERQRSRCQAGSSPEAAGSGFFGHAPSFPG